MLLIDAVSIPNRERDLLRQQVAKIGNGLRAVSIPNRERDLLRLAPTDHADRSPGDQFQSLIGSVIY